VLEHNASCKLAYNAALWHLCPHVCYVTLMFALLYISGVTSASDHENNLMKRT